MTIRPAGGRPATHSPDPPIDAVASGTRPETGGSGLSRRASLNAVAAAVDYGARVLIQLLLAPFMLGALGASGFGAWQVLQRLIGHATPAGGRPTEALKWVVAHRQASTDQQRKREQVGTAILAWLLFLPLVLLIGGVLAWFSPAVVHASPHQAWAVRAAAGLLVVNVAALGLAGLPQAVLQGENLGYRRLGLSTTVLVLGSLTMVLTLTWGWGLPGLAAATVLVTLLSSATYLQIVRRCIPWWGVARPQPGGIGRFVRLSGWFLLWNLVMQAIKGSDLIVLSAAAGTTAVASYSLTSMVPLAVSDTVFLAISATMPGLGGIVGSGDLRRAARVRNETLVLCWVLATAAGAVVVAWLPAFVRLWVGDRYDAGTTATVLITLMVLQLVLIRVDSNVIDVTLQVGTKVMLGLASVALAVGAALALIRLTDHPVAALVAGFIVGRVPLTIAYPMLVARLLQRPRVVDLRALARPAIVTVVVFVSAVRLRPHATAGGWVSLVLLGLATTAGVLAFIVWAGLDRGQRSRLVVRAQRVVRRS